MFTSSRKGSQGTIVLEQRCREPLALAGKPLDPPIPLSREPRALRRSSVPARPGPLSQSGLSRASLPWRCSPRERCCSRKSLAIRTFPLVRACPVAACESPDGNARILKQSSHSADDIDDRPQGACRVPNARWLVVTLQEVSSITSVVLGFQLRRCLERAELGTQHCVHRDLLTKIKPWNALVTTNDFMRRKQFRMVQRRNGHIDDI
jgi:hypothetical protein